MPDGAVVIIAAVFISFGIYALWELLDDSDHHDG
jgi:hypothetical protein